MPSDHLGLLCDIGELSASLAGSADIEMFLQRIVAVVAKHLRAKISSIYLHDDRNGELVLRANLGFGADAVGRIRLPPGEGLVSLALAEMRPICEKNASRNPRFKLFTGIDEERYDAFLAVPIQRGVEKIGVVVVQRVTRDDFDEHDVQALRATASQLAGAIENARVLMAMRRPSEATPAPLPMAMELIKGRAAADGYACTEAVPYDHQWNLYRLAEEATGATFTMADFQAAVATTERQLEDLQARLAQRLPEVASLIFSAHLLMLKDPNFTGQMADRISADTAPPAAVAGVARRFIDIFQASPNGYIREKAQDVEDVAKRLLHNLVHKQQDAAPDCQGRIVVARDLYPSDILKLASEGAAGLILVSGGVTSHVAILARSLDLPLVIADHPHLLQMTPHTRVLLDAESGTVYLNPAPAVEAKYRERNEASSELRAGRAHPKPATLMADGTRVRLLANINLLGEVKLARDLQAEGIGLYRTEFPFLLRQDFPSEEEQLVVYSSLIEQMPDKEITFRTLDIGGDKLLPYFADGLLEENPILGMRSIRFSLRYPDIFQQQLRAILRAGVVAPKLRIMFPMIGSLDEFLTAKAELDRCLHSLRQEGLPHHPAPAVGMMVEIPSVVHVIDDFAQVADFFCIGSNDFTQFMLAVDRTNEKVANYFQPRHPAVLRALKLVADAARDHKVDLSICGEMAHDPESVPLLVGMGYRKLSLDPRFLARVQEQLSSLTIAQAEASVAPYLGQRRR